MQDYQPTATSEVSGKMDSSTNNNNQNAATSDSDSQGSTLASFKRYLPVVKWIGSSTKDFFVSGQFKRTIRSPIQFVNPRHLSIPQTFGDSLSRLAKNWGFYKSNYAIITFMCCFAWLITSPYSLGVMALLALMWFYVIKTSGQTLSVGQSEYGPMQKYLFAVLATVLCMLFFGIVSTLLSGLSVGAGVSSLHAVCHVRPVSEDEKLRSLNDIENDSALTANTSNSLDNNNINTLNGSNSAANGAVGAVYDPTSNTVNGLDIMQFSDCESINNNSSNKTNINDINAAEEGIDRMMDTNGAPDGSPELGL